jgi:hypothetical protein
MQAHRASRTAVLVCQGRAAAHQRIAPDRFCDPAAMAMLRGEERVAVEHVRTGPPRGWAQRTHRHGRHLTAASRSADAEPRPLCRASNPYLDHSSLESIVDA